ncbi:MAG: alpha/beta hydrolase [Muribaculaceae bacterium]|nr:alpha/beta hydrolase [Muribaculaceae bacterium]
MKNSIKGLTLFILLLSNFNFISFAQGVENKEYPIEIPLWDNKKSSHSNNLPNDAETVENPGWINMVTKPELYVYPAENPNGKAILLCPGGGYSGVAIKHEGKDWAKFLNPEGITLSVLKYRMPNKNSEVPYEDVVRALEILHENSSHWGINPSMIGIAGASAGGHLASTMATHLNDETLKPAFQVLLYPVITMDETFTHMGSRENLLGENPTSEKVKYYSNELNVSAQTPPSFIALSSDDRVVPVKNSLVYYEALIKNGIPAALFIYPTGGHGWGYNPDFPYNEAWTFELINWLNNIK